MKNPLLFFAGSDRLSVLAVNSELIGWGKPNTKYFFQVWRDIPSHIIYYRDKTQVNFLPSLQESAVEPPINAVFRYDYLAKGEVPSGFWLQFKAGINENVNTGFVSDIIYKQYDPYINNLTTTVLCNDQIYLKPEDFFILLTNLSSSTGIDEILDTTSKNVLVGDDDKERRRFNATYFESYFGFVKTNILENPSFLSCFLHLSGSHILAYLMTKDFEVREYITQNITNLENPLYQLHPLLLESSVESDDVNQILSSAEVEMKKFQDENKTTFYMNEYQ